MKRIMFLGMVAGAAIMAAGGTVQLYSCNTVGVHRVTGASVVEVPVPFEAIGGGDITLDALLYTDTLAAGDNVQICRNRAHGFYHLWSVAEQSGALTSSTCREQTSGGDVEVPAPEANKCAIPRGTGIKVACGDSTASRAVYVMGQCTTASLSTTLGGGASSYLVNPFQRDLDIETAFTATNGVHRNDRIIIQEGGAQKVYQWNKNGANDQHWRTATVERGQDGVDVISYGYDSPKIGPGKGFVYERNAATDLTFTW